MRLLPILPAIALFAACSTAPAPTAAPAAERPAAVRAQERTDYWVERFSNGDKRPEIEAAFARKAQYGPMIAMKLQERGLPEQLLYLAMAESGLNPQAHSAAAAAGIWQMIPDTAKRYGLDVTEGSDERHDPEKSTEAALEHLTRLYKRFGSWYLAAAAYNAGEGRIGRIMTEATGSERGTDEDYFRIWDQLPGETRDYVPAMLALERIGRDPVKYGFGSR